MRISDVLRHASLLALQSPARSALSLAGVAIGCCTLTLALGLLMGISHFLDGQTRSEIVPVTVEVTPSRQSTLSLRSIVGEESDDRHPLARVLYALFARESFDPEQVSILSHVPHVVGLQPRLSLWAASVELEGLPGRASMVPLVPASPADAPWRAVAAGQWLGRPDGDEVVLPGQILRGLGLYRAEDAIGRKVVIELAEFFPGTGAADGPGPEPGAPARTVRWEATVRGVAPRSLLSAVYLPDSTALRLARELTGDAKLGTPESMGGQAILRVDGPEHVAVVAASVRALGMGAQTLGDRLDSLDFVFDVLKSSLALFAALMLTVACLGILNTLVIAAYQHARFVGLLRALGASKATVRTIFSMEGALLGSAGGFAGLVLALLVGWRVDAWAARTILAGWEGYHAFQPPWWIVPAIPFLGGFAGYFGALYPAWRASRADPLETLRAGT